VPQKLQMARRVLPQRPRSESLKLPLALRKLTHLQESLQPEELDSRLSPAMGPQSDSPLERTAWPQAELALLRSRRLSQDVPKRLKRGEQPPQPEDAQSLGRPEACWQSPEPAGSPRYSPADAEAEQSGAAQEPVR